MNRFDTRLKKQDKGGFMCTRVVPQNLLDLFMYLVIVELADVRTDNLIRQGEGVVTGEQWVVRGTGGGQGDMVVTNQVARSSECSDTYCHIYWYLL